MTLSLEILGSGVALTVPDAATRSACAALLRGFEATREQARPSAHYGLVRTAERWEISSGGVSVDAAGGLSEALALLEARLIHDALRRRSDLFHLHAACVAPRRGKGCLAVVGPSGCGKTTLALALMARGFAPLGDDVAMIDPATLTVEPFRRAFHVKDGILPPQGTTCDGDELSVSYAGCRFLHPRHWPVSPRPVALIVVLTRSKADDSHVERVSLAEAACALLTNSGSLSVEPSLALATATRLAQHAACYVFPDERGRRVQGHQQARGCVEQDHAAVREQLVARGGVLQRKSQEYRRHLSL